MPHRLKELNLNHLLALNALLEEANVTRAARRLHLTQSATSHALSSLRKIFEDELLVRTARGMVLTEKASRLAPELRRALAQLADAICDEQGHFEPRNAAGTLTLASADFLLARSGGRLGAVLAERAPRMELTLLQLQTSHLSEALETRTVDMVIGPELRTESGIHSEFLFEEPFVCAVGSGHPLGKRIRGKQISMDDYLSARHILISPTRRGAARVDSALAELGLRREVAVRVESFLAAVHMLPESPWLLTAPRSSLSALLPSKVRLFDMPLDLAPLRLHLYVHAARATTTRMKWLREQVRVAFAPVP
ncbi:MAG: LysR family transcriptional regulator [Myxococcota bacterium]